MWEPDRRSQFTKAIVRIHPGTFRHEKLAETPGQVSAGIALQRGRLYFAINSHLWSYLLPSRSDVRSR